MHHVTGLGGLDSVPSFFPSNFTGFLCPQLKDNYTYPHVKDCHFVNDPTAG